MGKVLKVLVPLLAAGALAAAIFVPRLPVMPAVHSPDRAAAEITTMSPSDQWAAAFYYGELSGALPLAEVMERADALPDALAGAYVDGYAHEVRPGDVQAFGREVEETAPHHLRGTLHDGAVMAILRGAETPQEAVLGAEAYGQEFGVSVSNGLRIAHQRRYGGDMAVAIALALEYPESYHPPVFEELGWRVGEEDGWDEQRLDALVQTVPEGSRCVFLAGADRALTLNQRGWGSEEDYARLAGRADAPCREERIRGLGQAALILFDRQPEWDRLMSLADPEDRALLQSAIDHELGR